MIVDEHGACFVNYCKTHANGKTIGLATRNIDDEMFINYGETSEKQAQNLFSLLREADLNGIDTVFVEMPSKEGVGLAVFNRLLRAAGFEIVKG